MVFLMIKFTQGNLLDADVEAVVNTVNTVGVMGKGIALMFKERFPENFAAYARACKAGDVRLGEMFVTRSVELQARAGSSISPRKGIGDSARSWSGCATAWWHCVSDPREPDSLDRDSAAGLRQRRVGLASRCAR